MTPRVSVVVPTRNRAGSLPQLLEALAGQDFSPLEVIVVDDASTDETPRILEAWQGAGRVALRLDRPGGSYAARNAGWRAARGDLVAFIDDDCLPDRGWVSALARALSGAAGAQGMTLAEGGEITPFTHQIEQRRPGPPYRTCNMAYRRDVLERVGGFDETFRWYGDNILGLRVRQMGEIAWAPDAVVRHPPRERQWRDREDWLARFDADARHRAILHDLGAERVIAPRGLLPVLLWVLRPLVKQSLSHLRYAAHHPRGYLRGLRPMLAEKRALAAAMREYYRGSRDQSSRLPPLLDEPAVSVVVVTRDRPRYLTNVLAALEIQTWPRRSVVVVNNGAEQVQVPHGVEVVEASGLRLSEARQRGLEAAAGEVVAFTDDDCLPAPDWLERLVAAFRADGTLRGVQGRTVPGAGPPGWHAVRVERPNRLYQTCNIAYRREALVRAGGFDTAFDGWFEDTALAARVLGDGPIGFAPHAVVTHVAVPRRPFDHVTWRRVLADERRLAERYPDFYRRMRGPSVTVSIVSRWLLGSPVKAAVTHVPRRGTEVPGYGRFIVSLLQERWDLLRVLLEGK